MGLKWKGNCYEPHFPHMHPDFYAEALIPTVTIFGDRAFMEVIKVK